MDVRVLKVGCAIGVAATAWLHATVPMGLILFMWDTLELLPEEPNGRA